MTPPNDDGLPPPELGGAIALLLLAAREDRLAQSVLLTGPPGVGKRAAALRIAQTLLCTADAPARPCGGCRACRLVEQGGHPDLTVADTPLRIDAVRESQARLALTPAEGRVRVVVLPDLDLATPAAANCLLKTLEEPPPDARLLLTSAAPGEVLATIRSRCQIVRVPRWSAEAITADLLDAGVGAEEAALLARLADGRVRLARELAAQPELRAERGRWFAELAASLREDVAERLIRAARLAAADEDAVTGLALWRSVARDVLLAACGSAEDVVNTDVAAEVEAWARALGRRRAVALVAAVETALRRLAANGNRQLVLEALVLALPRVAP